MDKGWLGILQLSGDVSRQAEIWILVDGTRDETWNVGLRAEDVREGIGEGWSGLDGSKMYFPDVITITHSLR